MVVFHTAHRSGVIKLFVILLMLLVLDSSLAWAADKSLMNPDNILDEIRTTVKDITPKLLGFARTLFMGLATVSLGIGLAQMILSGESNLGSVAAHLLKWIIYVGFFMFVMGVIDGRGNVAHDEGNFFLPNIIADSFLGAGTHINGDAVTPGGILSQGIHVFGRMTEAANALGWVKEIVAGLAGMVILVIFGMLAAVLTATYIEMYLVICGGSILLGFAGISYTKDIALAYLKYAVSVGMKLLIIALIAVVSNTITTKWADALQTIGEGEFFELVGYLIGGSITLLTAAQMVPSIAQNAINGASVSTGAGVQSMAMAAAMAPAKAARSAASGVANILRAGEKGGAKNIAGYLGMSALLGAGSRQAQARLGLDKEGNPLKNGEGKNGAAPGGNTSNIGGDNMVNPSKEDKRNA